MGSFDFGEKLYGKEKMQNTTFQNNGKQIFQENNYYNSERTQFKTADLIQTVKKCAKMSHVILAIMGEIFAEIASVVYGYRECIEQGVLNILSTFKTVGYVVFVGILLLIIIQSVLFILRLLTKKSFSAYIRKGNYIYKIIPRKCPICGSACNGKLKINIKDSKAVFRCNRDNTHEWPIEYSDVMNNLELEICTDKQKRSSEKMREMQNVEGNIWDYLKKMK